MAVTAGPLGTEEIVYVAREDGCACRGVERQDLATSLALRPRVLVSRTQWCRPNTGKPDDTCLRANKELPGREGFGSAPIVVEANTTAENQGVV